MKDFKELIEPFQRYFQIVIADTPERMEQVHRVRYEVFCKEFHFEREEDCPGGLEKDDYDAQSVHCLIIHRVSGLPAGCVRLVGTCASDPMAPLPLERYCAASLQPGELHPSRLPRASLCEISRLAVAGQFRRRKGESGSPVGASQGLTSGDRAEHRVFPLLSFVLVVAVLSLVVLTRRQDSLAMMEPWLAQYLRLMGLSFHQVGEVTDYHGLRAAFHYVTAQIIADKEQRHPLRQVFATVDPLVEMELLRVGLMSR